MPGPPPLPLGTQVVVREDVPGDDGMPVQRGATGRVTEIGGDGRYVVQLPTGQSLHCRREQLGLRRAYQADAGFGRTSASSGHQLVVDHTILASVVGSRAFGLATDESDTDVRGVYVAPTQAFWGLAKPPTHVDGPQPEWFSWEIERFCELALKSNPNALELLSSPLHRTVTPWGEELLGLRPAFLSQLAYQTFTGYVLSQFKKLEADLRRDGAPKWKHVMHLLRLLLSAGDLLRTGDLVLDPGPHRERLLAVRRGEESWDSAERWRLTLHADLDKALEYTTLPLRPDVDRVSLWLSDIRRRSAQGEAS